MTKKIAGLGPPHPNCPYWTDYDQMEDEKLAERMIHGWQVVDAAGRSKIEYPSKNSSPQERLARAALARLVMHQFRSGSFLIGYWLCHAIKNDGTTPWRIDFTWTKRGRRSNHLADLQISQYVQGLAKEYKKIEAAVENAAKKFAPRPPPGP